MQVILVSDREKQQINPSIQSTGAHLSDEICDCIQKLLEVKALLRRDAKANKTRLQESDIPKL